MSDTAPSFFYLRRVWVFVLMMVTRSQSRLLRARWGPPAPVFPPPHTCSSNQIKRKKANKQTNTQKRFDASFLALKQSKRNTLRNRDCFILLPIIHFKVFFHKVYHQCACFSLNAFSCNFLSRFTDLNFVANLQYTNPQKEDDHSWVSCTRKIKYFYFVLRCCPEKMDLWD